VSERKPRSDTVLSFGLKKEKRKRKKAISESWKSLNKIEKPYFGVFVQALFNPQTCPPGGLR
jgi:hypothetical protein